jgi:hypothetical protein
MSDELTIKDAGSYIHYQPERVDYAISEGELALLRACTDNLWKDFCLFCTGAAIPCVVNAINEIRANVPFQPTLIFNINLVLGIVGLVLGAAFGIAWYRTRKSSSAIITAIKSKPRIRIH